MEPFFLQADVARGYTWLNADARWENASCNPAWKRGEKLFRPEQNTEPGLPGSDPRAGGRGEHLWGSASWSAPRTSVPESAYATPCGPLRGQKSGFKWM